MDQRLKKHEVILESVALHLTFSLLILFEGMVRLTGVVGTGKFGGQWTASDQGFPPIAFLLSSLGEVIFGLIGSFWSLLFILTRRISVSFTLVVIALELILGWFVFVVYSIAAPAYDADHDIFLLPGFSQSEFISIIVIGILGSIAYCASLLGAQAFFAFDVLAHLKGTHAERNTAKAFRGRAIFYGFLFFLGALMQLTIGAYLSARSTSILVVSPPFFVTYSGIAIAVGCFSTLISLLFLLNLVLPHFIFVDQAISFLCFCSWTLNIALSIITQLGLAMPTTALLFPVGQLGSLTFALHFMPCYLLFQMRRCQQRRVDDID